MVNMFSSHPLLVLSLILTAAADLVVLGLSNWQVGQLAHPKQVACQALSYSLLLALALVLAFGNSFTSKSPNTNA